MTRKSKREIERSIENLIDDPDCGGDVTDVGLGVTADFVTYETNADGTGPQFQTVDPEREER
ncbi:hypothetical protein [Haloarcula salina]|uniref:Uncharacterized protein n=1 Tax=Haloarcula salina TaxID=1429914 RepID=A0AA41FX41_9EURY|nr:hypothetical protein [Haloarcula salina]MBV0900165.1 hypothetical protein [Haloarcula salina]